MTTATTTVLEVSSPQEVEVQPLLDALLEQLSREVQQPNAPLRLL
ncbi:hypothetical protein [Hymenobacter tenuis]